MDAATLQSRIYQGYAKAALRIGALHQHYRPTGTTSSVNPLANVLRTLPVSFNAEDMGYAHPNKYGKVIWYALLDGSLTQPGDYLQGPSGTFFIAAQQQALPILVVECSRTIRIARNVPPNKGGAVGYGGIIESKATDVLGTSGASGNLITGWPASVLLGGGGGKAGDEPMSVKSAGYQVLLPRSVPITIVQGDILHDEFNRRYSVYAAELTDLGWCLNVNEEHT